MLFVHPFSHTYDTEEKVSNHFNQLHGKECSLQNDNIILTSPIVIDDIKSSREKFNMGHSTIFVTMFKQEKKRLVPKSILIYVMDHWYIDSLIEFWICWYVEILFILFCVVIFYSLLCYFVTF